METIGNQSYDLSKKIKQVVIQSSEGIVVRSNQYLKEFIQGNAVKESGLAFVLTRFLKMVQLKGMRGKKWYNAYEHELLRLASWVQILAQLP